VPPGRFVVDLQNRKSFWPDAAFSFQRKEDRVKLTGDIATIASHAEMSREIAALVNKYYEG
jgi:hypothetical protein